MATKQDLIDALNRAADANDISAANEIAEYIEAGNYEEERTFTDDLKIAVDENPVVGAAENILSIASGAIADPIAGLSGIAAGVFGDQDVSAASTVESVQDALTYKPRTTAGKETQQTVSNALSPVGDLEDFLGEGTLELTGSPLLAAGAATIPTAVMEAIGVKGARGAKRAPEPAPEPVISDGKFSGTEIPATRGEQLQASGSGDAFDQLKEEQFLLEQSGDAGDDLRSFKKAQSEEVKKYISDISPENAAEVGKSVKDAIELRNNSARYKRTLAYDKLAEVTKDTNVELNTDVLGGALPEAGILRDFAATQPGQFKALSNLLTEFGVDKTPSSISRAAKDGVPITPLSVENAERFRVRLNGIDKADQTGSTSRITGPIKSALDSEFDIAAKALEANGSENVARAAKNARSSHAALKTEFDQKGMVDRLTAPSARGSRIPKIEESQVYKKLASNSTPIEQFDSVISSLNKAGSKGKIAKDAIKSQMILDLIDSGFSAGSRKVQGERIFGPGAFSKRFDQMEQKLSSVMSKNEMDKLKSISKISRNLTPPSGAIPKGSAGFFIDTIDRIGLFGLLSKIPGAGPILAEQTKVLGRRAKNSKATRVALSNPKTKETFDLINSDYPSLAAVLGIGQIKAEDDATEEEENK